MRGSIILSHGFESGPEAAKTTAMAAVAERRGWRTLRPDYRDLDTNGLAASLAPRVARLRALCAGMDAPCVLAGSSMGAFVSGLVSREVACRGLFLLAVPVLIPGWPEPFDLADGVPVTLVHGFSDQLCPADSVVDLARRRHLRLLMVADSHRLADHVDWIAGQFGLFLDHLDEAAAA